MWFGSTYFFRQSSVMITDVFKKKKRGKKEKQLPIIQEKLKYCFYHDLICDYKERYIFARS